MSAPVRDASDAEDIKKAQEFLAGDSRAFEFLFDKYREKVYRIAFRFVRNRDDALDVTQEVFLKVCVSLSKFKTDSKFFTWLYRIAVNRAIDFTRHKKSRPLHDLDPEVLETHAELPVGRSTGRTPVEIAEERDLQSLVARAVSKLSEKHRSVFLLHASENLSYKEIAKVLECSIGTVMSRLFYARKKLQAILGAANLEALGRNIGPEHPAGETAGGAT